MPKFIRPNIGLKTNIFQSDDTTKVFEEQMQYDLIEEQEKANDLMKDKIKAIQELSDTIEANEEQKELKQHEKEEEAFKKQLYLQNRNLCNQYKISYDLLKRFSDYIETNDLYKKMLEIFDQIKLLEDDYEENDNDHSKEIKKLYKECDRITQERQKLSFERTMNFIQFRQNHYNEELETLFPLINLPVFVINQKDIKGTGTRQDYVEYISEQLNK